MKNSNSKIIIERVFNTSPETIWKMWTVPEHFAAWYGPKGFNIEVIEMNVVVGGKQMICMISPDGSMKMYTKGNYSEIVPQSRLAYTDSACDDKGNLIPPEAMGMPPGSPQTTIVTVDIESINDQTKMTLCHEGVPEGAKNGWEQAFDKMLDLVQTL